MLLPQLQALLLVTLSQAQASNVSEERQDAVSHKAEFALRPI
jgi:hypothetical protein